jgi:hypothetical protein
MWSRSISLPSEQRQSLARRGRRVGCTPLLGGSLWLVSSSSGLGSLTEFLQVVADMSFNLRNKFGKLNPA